MAKTGNIPAAPKRVRTCIACGSKGPKTGLSRIVRGAGGVVSFDEGGRAPGRGAYVCSATCFESARGARLDRALRTKVGSDECDRIAAQLRLREESPERDEGTKE